MANVKFPNDLPKVEEVRDDDGMLIADSANENKGVVAKVSALFEYVKQKLNSRIRFKDSYLYLRYFGNGKNAVSIGEDTLQIKSPNGETFASVKDGKYNVGGDRVIIDPTQNRTIIRNRKAGDDSDGVVKLTIDDEGVFIRFGESGHVDIQRDRASITRNDILLQRTDGAVLFGYQGDDIRIGEEGETPIHIQGRGGKITINNAIRFGGDNRYIHLTGNEIKVKDGENWFSVNGNRFQFRGKIDDNEEKVNLTIADLKRIVEGGGTVEGYIYDAANNAFAAGNKARATGGNSFAEGYQEFNPQGELYVRPTTSEERAAAKALTGIDWSFICPDDTITDDRGAGVSIFGDSEYQNKLGHITEHRYISTDGDVQVSGDYFNFNGSSLYEGTLYYWAIDTGANGYYSHAEGYNTTASGYCSHAEGEYTTASGDYSHAEGEYTTASGDSSHAEGYNTTASGYCSHAEGYNTTASGDYSHAEGEYTTASGDSSHAEGYNTTASGDYSHAEGYNTTASGYCSHAEGENTTASGDYSHAEGYNTTASGYCSHAEGEYTTASGYCSHAGGNGETYERQITRIAEKTWRVENIALINGIPLMIAGGTSVYYIYDVVQDGYNATFKVSPDYIFGNGIDSGNVLFLFGSATEDGSFSHGLEVTAVKTSQFVIGERNVPDTNDEFAFIIGNGGGRGDAPRNVPFSNALAVKWGGTICMWDSNGDRIELTPARLAALLALVS